MPSIIPKPIREFINHPIRIVTSACSGNANYARFVTSVRTKQLVELALRTAVAAAGVYAVAQGGSLGLALGLGSVVSFPATMLAVGGYAAYVGVSAIASSVAMGSFVALGMGLATAFAGWLTLECYDFMQFGTLEYCIIQPLGDKAGDLVGELF